MQQIACYSLLIIISTISVTHAQTPKNKSGRDSLILFKPLERHVPSLSLPDSLPATKLPTNTPKTMSPLFTDVKSLLKKPDTKSVPYSEKAFDLGLVSKQAGGARIGSVDILGSAQAHQWVDRANAYNDVKSLGVSVRLDRRISLNGSVDIGLTSSPFVATIEKYYRADLGVTLRPMDNMRLSAGIGYGSYMRQQFINPYMNAGIRLGDHVDVMLNGGAMLYNTPFSQGFNNANYYGNMRVNYMFTPGSGFYIYGTGYGGYSSSPYFNQNFNAMNRSFGVGGGVGYMVEGGGRIEGGVNYEYDPRTGRMRPVPYVNLTGLIDLIIKKIKDASE
ncbi:hypothetical protein [Porphyromonas pogonae]|uniref:hypothetical protein n=1 Tax=Porphyromonas pogonae TaxID=867595 RepID=UPI002E77DAD9|nr:hypothetical protein [Porphyromonas pogonae]